MCSLRDTLHLSATSAPKTTPSQTKFFNCVFRKRRSTTSKAGLTQRMAQRMSWALDYELVELLQNYGIHLCPYYLFTEPQFSKDVVYGTYKAADIVDNPQDPGNTKFKNLCKMRHNIISQLLWREKLPPLNLSSDFSYLKYFSDQYLRECFGILKDRCQRDNIQVADEDILKNCYYWNHVE